MVLRKETLTFRDSQVDVLTQALLSAQAKDEKFDALEDQIQEWMQGKSRWAAMPRLQPLALAAVSAIPFRGFGIFSACILAAILGYRRLEGTLLIMSGSFIGATVSIIILYFPAKWINAF